MYNILKINVMSYDWLMFRDQNFNSIAQPLLYITLLTEVCLLTQPRAKCLRRPLWGPQCSLSIHVPRVAIPADAASRCSSSCSGAVLRDRVSTGISFISWCLACLFFPLDRACSQSTSIAPVKLFRSSVEAAQPGKAHSSGSSRSSSILVEEMRLLSLSPLVLHFAQPIP